MSIEEKRKLISDYMSACPFIEFHDIDKLDEERATISIAFDSDIVSWDDVEVAMEVDNG